MLDLSSLDLEEIGNALADQTGYEHRWLINPQTGDGHRPGAARPLVYVAEDPLVDRSQVGQVVAGRNGHLDEEDQRRNHATAWTRLPAVRTGAASNQASR